ncbi:sulfatase family protein [Niabella drilacis]|uniref:Arylsulfatase A n=1 Tax=Niabella drilacis (strain DSM 25811 / CCM 8410 / CCUG 62505 / LMG 26954 / E90) TaxID=1285928 RepID=A0A1G6R1M7_NIADE|nr:arylsulfatase [Niabella drilacis]SDC98134.1 Arylsulfatase A [Niabella drilacis]
MKDQRRGLLLLLCIVALNSFAQTSHPNIIYILADDLGYGDISALNAYSKIPTKNIDALADAGMVFTDAHSNSAVCTPTRYGILTGRYAWRTRLQNGVLWSYDAPLIAPNRSTIASLLKRRGYQTACIGKWHLGLGWQKDANGRIDFTREISGGPASLGFDYFYGITASLDIPPYFYIENNKITATAIDSIKGSNGMGFWRAGPIGNDFEHATVLPRFTQKAVTYIKEKSRSKAPFFLYLALPSPHTPILPSASYKGKTATNDYGDFVLMTDDMVGCILQAVKDAGIGNNTLIVFTSDNGVSPSANLKELSAAGHSSSYTFRGNKADIYEGGHRIPFIVKWPGMIPAGTSSGVTVCLTDFMATAAALTGPPLKATEGEDSYDLLPLLLQKGKYKRTATIHHSIDGNFAIREGKWKLEFAYGSGGWSVPVEKEARQQSMPPLQLYNLEQDPAEQTNVAAQNPEIVARLKRNLQHIISNGRSTSGTPQANDVKVNYLQYQ